MKRYAAAAIVAAFIGGALAACFSEHVAPDTTNLDLVAICANAVPIPANMVIIRNFAFSPSTITVPHAGSVTWVNCESTPGLAHTATHDGGSWRSGLMPPLTSHTQTFPQAGSFPYHCEPHPAMKATVVVQ